MKRKNQYTLSLIILLFLLTVISCDSDIDIRQDYGFNVRTQKYRTEITEGETKELEFFIDKEGNYKNTQYYVSVFIRSGQGTLSDGKTILKENTFYEVSQSGFKLYYTSKSAETHRVEVLVKDSFGKEKETIINLSNK